MITITATQPVHQPPLWAILERDLIRLMNGVYVPVMEKYVRPDGSMLWPTEPSHSGIDALDDMYESFHNWPLFYLLGGDGVYLDLSLRQFDAITGQFEQYDTGHGHPMVVKEYEQGYDWFHQGEGYLFFYLLCLATPDHPPNRERALRYAGFYLNEDPDALNYDERLQLIKCAHTGSKGPAFRNFTGGPWNYEEWKSFYGLPFADVPGCRTIEDIRLPDRAAAMGRVVKERMSRGDVVVNLSVTSLISSAYMMSGDNKYKAWVKEYVESWMRRTESNGGIVPDNVGLSGIVGEYTGGKWYGGNYGWTWPHGWLSIGDAVTTAGQNAALLLKNTDYLDFPRSQIDALAARGFEHEGTFRVPYKYGDAGTYDYRLWIHGVVLDDDKRVLWKDGWFEFQPMDARFIAAVWNMSEGAADLERGRKLRNFDKRDWETVIAKPNKDQGGHEAAWLAYAQGEFPDYPVQILQHNLAQVYERLNFMRHDSQDPSTYTDSYLQARNPISVEGLVQLTMGAPLPVYNGGLLMARVRYFDTRRNRPGLPEDVAALVESIEAEKFTLHLINLHGLETRELIVQAGAFGEHRFETVRYQGWENGVTTEHEVVVGENILGIVLTPASRVALRVTTSRFVNDPAYRMTGLALAKDGGRHRA